MYQSGQTIRGDSKKWTYDGKNVARVAYVVDNSQICIERYNRTLGTLTSVDAGGSRVWSLLGEDEMGRPTTVGLGSLTQHLGYDPTGREAWRNVGRGGMPAILNLAYDYDCETGNMMMRTDSIYGHEEAFAYDHLNRLCEAGSDSYAYDTKGNMTRRSGVGDYVYDVARPFAVSQVPFNAMIPQREQFISYNALQQPDSIIEGGATATFTYGADLQRSSMRVTRGETSLSAHYYDGTFNSFHRLRGENLDVKQILYLAGDAYTAPAAMVRDYGSGSWKLCHIIRDNQNSIVAVTDTSGNVLEHNSYDPWGVRRDQVTHLPYATGDEPELLLGRGYCGHEHLPDFGLINMNARLYDPVLCRFLSPDPVVQSPFTPQNLNRYAYCLNNPLRYTDPTGMVSYDLKNWQVELDEVVVKAKRPAPILPWGVNHYRPLDPGEWMQYYGQSPDTWIESGYGEAVDVNQGGYTSSSDGRGVTNMISIINTAVSFPVNTTNQWWKYVRNDEERQIAALQQRLSSTPSAETERLLQSKAAQYETIAKSTKALKFINRGLIGVTAVTTVVDVGTDIANGKKMKAGARFAVAIATCLSSYIPVVGPFVSVGLGIADAVWGEELYDWLEKEF